MKAWAAGLVGLALSVGVAEAQDADGAGRSASAWSRAGLTGSLRLALWSSNRELDDETARPVATAWLKVAPDEWRGFTFLFEGRAQARGTLERVDDAVGVRDAFMSRRLGSLDLRVGRQVIPWGRADGINPTDNLTPRDFTMLAANDADDRLGASALKATWHRGGLSLTGVWLPEFVPHVVPLPVPPGATLDDTPVDGPRRRWGVRLDQSGAAVDWSVSWFEGPDLAPDLGVDQRRRITLGYPRVRVVGGDAVAVVGRYALRLEAAYTATPDADGTNPFVRNPFALVVAGIERTFREYANINVQYVGRFVRRHGAIPSSLGPQETAVARQHAILANQTSGAQHGLTVRVANRWRRETLDAEVAAAGFLGPAGYVVKPRIAWSVTDRWKLVAGGDWFDGDDESFYRLLRQNAAFFTELRWSF